MTLSVPEPGCSENVTSSARISAVPAADSIANRADVNVPLHVGVIVPLTEFQRFRTVSADTWNFDVAPVESVTTSPTFTVPAAVPYLTQPLTSYVTPFLIDVTARSWLSADAAEERP